MPPISSTPQPAPSPALARPDDRKERRTLMIAFFGSLAVNLVSVAVLGYARLMAPPPVTATAKKHALAVGVYHVPRSFPTPPPTFSSSSSSNPSAKTTTRNATIPPPATTPPTGKAPGKVASATSIAGKSLGAGGKSGPASGNAAQAIAAAVTAVGGATNTGKTGTGASGTQGTGSTGETGAASEAGGANASLQESEVASGKTGKTPGAKPGVGKTAGGTDGAKAKIAPNTKTATSLASALDAPGAPTDAAPGAASTRDGNEGEAAPAAKPGEKGKGTYVVPKVAKMWAVSPNQKLVLPDGMKLELPPNLPVIPGSALLTEDQLAQLRKLLLSQNLRQMKGLTKDQLKKMLAARKDSERPHSAAAALASASQPTAKKTETAARPRPRTPLKPRGAREQQVALAPPGMTSPFRYRTWNPVWHERYAPNVRDTEPLAAAESTERRRGTQTLNDPTRNATRDQNGNGKSSGRSGANGRQVAQATGPSASPTSPTSPTGSESSNPSGNPGDAGTTAGTGTPNDKTAGAGTGTGAGGTGQGQAGSGNGGAGATNKGANSSGLLGGGQPGTGAPGGPGGKPGNSKNATTAGGGSNNEGNRAAGGAGQAGGGTGNNKGTGQTAAGNGNGTNGSSGNGAHGQAGNGKNGTQGTLGGGNPSNSGNSGGTGKSGKSNGVGGANGGTAAGGGAPGGSGAGSAGGDTGSGSGSGNAKGGGGVLGGGTGNSAAAGGANGAGSGQGQQGGKQANGQGGTAAGGGAGNGSGGQGAGAGGQGNTGGTAAGGEGSGGEAGGAGGGSGGVGGSGLLSGVDFGPGLEAEGIAGETADLGDANGIDTGFVPAAGVSPNFPEHNAEQQNGLPGALVLPPLPPQGTETGKLNEPRPVKIARRASPATLTQAERRTKPQTASPAQSAKPIPARPKKPMTTVVGSASRRGSVPVTLVARGSGKAKLGSRGQLATRPDDDDARDAVRPAALRENKAAPDPLSAPLPERALREKRVVNSKGVRSGTKNPLPPTPLPDSDAELGDGSGLKGEYYLGRNFEQFQFTRADKNLDLFWGADRSPSPRLPIGADWSCRWWGRVQPRYSGTYTFYAVADDGVRVWINRKLVIDDWTLHPLLEYSGQVRLEAGKQYDIRVDYFESGGPPASIGVYWESDKQQKEFLPETCLFYPLPGEKMDMNKYEKPRR